MSNQRQATRPQWHQDPHSSAHTNSKLPAWYSEDIPSPVPSLAANNAAAANNRNATQNNGTSYPGNWRGNNGQGQQEQGLKFQQPHRQQPQQQAVHQSHHAANPKVQEARFSNNNSSNDQAKRQREVDNLKQQQRAMNNGNKKNNTRHNKPVSQDNEAEINNEHDDEEIVVPKTRTITHKDFLHPTATFATADYISSETRASLEKAGYTSMTKVQHSSIQVAVQHHDVLAKAPTGTGKTIAFGIPLIENIRTRILKSNTRGGSHRQGVSGMVLSPTRELAMQIYNQLLMLLAAHRELPIHAIVVYGGTSINKDIAALRNKTVDIVVATPGRLLDHLKTTDGFAGRCQSLQVVVLDEADRMLEMGFREDILSILSYFPRERQTLLFSATVPMDIVKIAPTIMQPTFYYTVNGTATLATASGNNNNNNAPRAKAGEGQVMKLVADDPLSTVDQVEQLVVTVEQFDQPAAVACLIREEMAKHPTCYKVIAFCVTARITQLYAELFNANKIPCLEMHSRKSQSHRTKTSDTFQDLKKAIMFSSDVTARGMDYADVTLVLQIGVPTSAEQYVHRLGRTARAGKSGRGVLVLFPDERYFLQSGVKALKIVAHDIATADMERENTNLWPPMEHLPYETKAAAYATWLGYYNSLSSTMRWSKAQLVAHANRYAMETLGLSSPPALEKKTIGKMGLKGVEGLVIEESGGFHSRNQPSRGQQQQRR